MKIPDSKIAQFFLFAVAEAFSFFIICANTRAVAMGSYQWTAVTDILFGGQSFVIAKLMIDDPKARSWAAGAGTVLGGATGSLFSIWLTKHLYGQ